MEHREEHREDVAQLIIQNHAAYAASAGLIPIPVLDFAAVTAIQVDMVRALARVYDVKFDDALGKALVGSLLGASATRVGASAVKALPVVGALAGVVAGVGLGAASTWALGQLFQAHFEEEGTLEDFDPDQARPVFEDLLERGRRFARPGVRDALDAQTRLLERIARLREEGIIDEHEFARLKARVMSA
ncbi:MAG: DUF697 domain-containing protein [Myxococcota bacterium]|nr:DUF697 domain-containing protein [Myxococcota bacterium]